MKNIVIVSHKFVTQPDDDLALYLNKCRFANVLHIRHSFAEALDRQSWFTWYKNGVVYKEKRTADYKWLSEPLIYVKELFFTLKWTLFSRIQWDVYVGMDGLCVLFGNSLRYFGRVKKTVYWVIDFVPEKRFNNSIKNFIYYFINTRGYRDSDELWDLSPRMEEAREKFLGVNRDQIKKPRIVPYGVWTDRIKKYSYNECQKNTLVFMGILVEKQGVQLVIRAIPEIIKMKPDFHFKIVGGGGYKSALEKLARDMNVYAFCDFKDKIDDITVLENEVACSCAGIAPYLKELDKFTYYADPGKVKTYLACGIPVLLTDVPWNAAEIEKAGCGKIIFEQISDIVAGITELMDPKKNQSYRDRAIQYSMGYDYANIFSHLSLINK